MNIQIDKLVYRSDMKTTYLASFPSKSLNYKIITSYLQNFSSIIIAKFTTSTRTDIKLHASVKNWEQMQCVAHSPLIVGVTIAFFKLLGTCIVRIQSVQVYFECTKRLLNLSVLVTINFLNGRRRVSCGMLFLKNNKFVFLEVWPRYFYIRRDTKIPKR